MHSFGTNSFQHWWIVKVFLLQILTNTNHLVRQRNQPGGMKLSHLDGGYTMEFGRYILFHVGGYSEEKYSYMRMLLVHRNSVQLMINLESLKITHFISWSQLSLVLGYNLWNLSSPGKMTEKKHDDNNDENAGQVHLVVRLAVPVCSHMGILYPLKTML